MHYATFDHLVLLMSRLSDFGGKDRHRKQRAIESQGGQWRPPAWLFESQKFGANVAPASGKSANKTSGQRAQQPETHRPTPSTESTRQLPRAPSANEGRTRQSRPTPSDATRQEGTPMFGMMPPPPVPPKMQTITPTWPSMPPLVVHLPRGPNSASYRLI